MQRRIVVRTLLSGRSAGRVGYDRLSNSYLIMTRNHTVPIAVLLAALTLHGQESKQKPELWSLRPVMRPAIPADARNPIDTLAARLRDEIVEQRGAVPAPAHRRVDESETVSACVPPNRHQAHVGGNPRD